jgi:PPOX class probable F420-dependent enzyme
MTEQEARARFAAARVARLATVDGEGRPHLVPVTFALEDASVFFAVDAKPKRSRDLKRLRNIAANPRVCLLVDEYDEDWRRLWWVRVDGDARVLDDEAERAHAADLLFARYPQYSHMYAGDGPGRLADAPAVVGIRVTRWSGWRFADHRSALS